jgi:hypothetical protein
MTQETIDKLANYAITIGVVILIIVISLSARWAFGRDLTGKWAQSNNRAWFESLRNRANYTCCANADGFQVDDPDWHRVGEDKFQVLLGNQWWDVAPENLVDGSNHVGYAMVWPTVGYDGSGHPFFNGIRCFLPGTEG